MTRFLLVLVALAFASIASAQAVTSPGTASFTHGDSDFTKTSSYHVELWLCNSVAVNGTITACVGRSTAPLSSFDVPRAQITSTGTARVINLLAAPASGILASVPNGVAFVATVSALGDGISAAGMSARSPDSNPSLARPALLLPPAAPGNVQIR